MAEEWAAGAIPDSDLCPVARAIVCELETSGMHYSDKLTLMGQVFAAISANEIKKAEKRSHGRLTAAYMRDNLMMYFHTQCKMLLSRRID